MITIDGYPIDASLTETHTYEADVTSYPVESGATVTDNVRPKPVTVSVECVVSDSPLAQVLAARRAKNLADPAFLVSPVIEAFDRMVQILNTREPVTIETGLAFKVYQNMVLISFVPTFDKNTGRALKFSASFTQITIVNNIRARIRVASTGVPSGKSKTSGPAVVIVNRPDVDNQNITTLSGRRAEWNDQHGRYEYASDESGDGGSPVPARDLGDYTKYDNKQTPVPDGGVANDPSELGPDGKPLNSTYYDYQDGAWKNTNGTPVTQQQLDSGNGLNSTGTKPWWQEPGKGGTNPNLQQTLTGPGGPLGPNALGGKGGPHPFGG